jgi:hypothetical protein
MNSALLNGLTEFFAVYPGMATQPSPPGYVCLAGPFSFKASTLHYEEIEDRYNLEIKIPDSFPRDIPQVREIGNDIPSEADFHRNADGSLCLGAPIAILKTLNSHPTFMDYIKRCLLPYLYAVSHKKLYGGDFVFGELAHGADGLIKEYTKLFGLQDKQQVIEALHLLTINKQVANKKRCPCGCGKKVSKCWFHKKILFYRKLALPSFYSEQLNAISRL